LNAKLPIIDPAPAHEQATGARAGDRVAGDGGHPEAEKHLNDYPTVFGGMRQRVMIAIALACNRRSWSQMSLQPLSM